MTKGTRYFLTGSALVLLLGVGTGLVAYYKGDLPLFKSRGVGPQELVYVSPDATSLAFANVHDVMASEFHHKLRQVLPTGAGKAEFLDQTGIDIERDIQSVLAATFKESTPADHSPGLLLIRGTFDEARIESLIRQHNGTVEDYAGKRVMVTRQPGQQAGAAFCLAFPEPGLAMVGSEARVKTGLDTRAAHRDISANSEMMKLVSQLDNGYNTAWAVGGVESLANSSNLPPQVKAQLPAVQWLAAAAHVDSGINGQLRAEAKDDKAAADLRAVVNGAVAAGRLVGGKDPKIDALLNSLQISGSGKDVALAFSISPEMIDMIAGFAGQAHHGEPTKKPAPAPQR
jgi:hypothetical protein